MADQINNGGKGNSGKSIAGNGEPSRLQSAEAMLDALIAAHGPDAVRALRDKLKATQAVNPTGGRKGTINDPPCPVCNRKPVDKNGNKTTLYEREGYWLGFDCVKRWDRTRAENPNASPAQIAALAQQNFKDHMRHANSGGQVDRLLERLLRGSK